MGPKDCLLLGLVGLFLWTLGAVYFGLTGGALIEGAFSFYVFNAAIAACAFGLIFRVTALGRGIPKRLWIPAAAAFAAPGLTLEFAVLANLDTLFADADPAMLGRYAGLVAFTYLVLPAFAWTAPNRAAQRVR
jgi:hypothetical protein